MDLFTVVYLSQDRYDEMLQRAETERRARRQRRSQSRVHRRVLHNMGDFLIAIGNKLQADYQAESAELALHPK